MACASLRYVCPCVRGVPWPRPHPCGRLCSLGPVGDRVRALYNNNNNNNGTRVSAEVFRTGTVLERPGTVPTYPYRCGSEVFRNGTTSFALLPACDLRPPANPPQTPPHVGHFLSRRPGIRTRDRQARRTTRKPVRHVHKMHEKSAASTGA